MEEGPAIRRYRVLERLGAGAMGVVYRALDPRLGREVAVKMLHPDALGARAVAQLRAEAQALARLSHPNVVGVLDVGEVRGRIFVAMELVRGQSMRAWIEEARPSARAILEKFAAVGRGLAAVHAVGLVHRDVKPDNVLIDEHGRPRIVDFGLARPASMATTDEAPSGVVTGRHPPTIAGSPGYVAPEQRFGCDVDARADQFSFCVSVVEALTGQRPKIDPLAERAPPLRIAGLPRSVARALRRGLSPRPADRFVTLDCLLEELKPRRSRRATIASVVLGVMTGLALLSLVNETTATDTVASTTRPRFEVRQPTLWQVLAESAGEHDRLDSHFHRAVTVRNNDRALEFAAAKVFSGPQPGMRQDWMRRAEVAWARIDSPTDTDCAFIEIARSHHADHAAALVHLDTALLALSTTGSDVRLRVVAFNQRGLHLSSLGYVDAARRSFREAIGILEHTRGVEKHLPASPYSNLAQLERNHGLEVAAERHYFIAWMLRRRHLGDRHVRTRESAERLIEWYALRGDLEEATLVLEATDRDTAARSRIARLDCLDGELLRRGGHARSARQRLESGRLNRFPTPVCAEGLAELLRAEGELERADSLLAEAVRELDENTWSTKALGYETRLRLVVRRGRVLLERGNTAEAHALLRDGLDRAQPALGPGSRWVREANELLQR